MGFKVNPKSKLCDSIEDVIAFCAEVRKAAVNTFRTKSMALSLRSIPWHSSASSVSPPGRRAGPSLTSTPARQATTKVDNIEVQVGRTGALTPVAKLVPGGGRRSHRIARHLHNEDEIERLGLQIGDEVVIERSRRRHPQVVRVSSQGSWRRPFLMPADCPVCGSRVVREEGEAARRCINASCPARLKETLLHFSSRGVMNIDGVGDALVDQLVDRGIVTSIADLYDLKIEDLMALERMGVKSAGNIIRNIARSKQNPLPRVILGVGYPLCG
jgi:DNA ligase (NAD+)